MTQQSQTGHTQAFELHLSTSEETERLGFCLASLVQIGVIVALQGPLGAGKTTFAKGAGASLQVEEVINSPTFTMLNEYTSGRMPLYHLDLYRVLDSDGGSGSSSGATLQLLQSELDELMGWPCLVLVEWPEVLSDYISQKDHIRIELNYSKICYSDQESDKSGGETARVARIWPFGEVSSRIVEALRNVYFS